MANIPSLPITVVARIVPGSLTIDTTYNNPSSVYDGYPYTFSATLEIVPAVNSDDRISPNSFNYDAYHITEGMWMGQTNGSSYQIISASVPTDSTHIDVILKDVDLFNLLNDSSISGSNTPTEGNFGVLFNLSEDGDTVLSAIELQRANLPDINYWLNDLYARFQYRNLLTSYYNNNPDNLVYGSGYTVGQLVYLDNAGQFQIVDSSVQNQLEKAFGIITSVNEPEDGNMTVKPFGKITGGLNLTGIGAVGDLLYYDSTATSTNYLTTSKPANYPLPVYIKISNTTAAFLGWPLTSGASGTSGGASGSSGTSGVDGASGITTGAIYYFNDSVIEVNGIKQLATEPTSGSQQTITTTVQHGGAEQLIESYISEQFGFNVIPGGVQRFNLWFTKPSSGDDVEVYVELSLRDSAGNLVATVGSSQPTNIGWNNNANTPVEVTTDITIPTSTVDPTYRMQVDVLAVNNENQDRDIVFYTEGTSHYSFVVTTVSRASGTSGISGTSGSSGFSGTSGISGIDGSSGTSGESGTSGIDGSSGSSGESGTSGQNGTSGLSGINGVDGIDGTSGISGIDGSSGTSGNSSAVTGMTLNGTILEIQNSDNTAQSIDFDPSDALQSKEGVTTHGFKFIDETSFNQIPFDALMGTTGTGYSDVMHLEILETDLTAKTTYVVLDVVNTGSTMNYVLLLPNLSSDYEGKLIKFVTKRNGLVVYNDILVASKWINSGNDYRIIATNLKTRVINVGYFVPLETLETTEILFDGFDWLVTDVQKQGYFMYQPGNYLLSSGTYGTAGSYKNRDIDTLL